MSIIIGIDLGTTNSLVGLVEGNKPIIISNDLGTNLMNSVVRILPDETCIVGNAAYRSRILDPVNTITSIKRFIGRKYNEVFDLASKVPYKVVVGPNNLAFVEAHNSQYSPQAISAMIISSLKLAAESYLGQEVTEAVITVPAYFNETQKKATKDAGELAGLSVRRIINEPTAAALAYGLDKTMVDQKIAVFDLGGGTFDISILELGEGVFEVKSISGDGYLGGDDFDEALARWIIEEIKLRYRIDPAGDNSAMSLIREAATKAKLELSSEDQTVISIPFFKIFDNPAVNISLPLKRSRFEEICEELFGRLVPPCLLALKNAYVNSSQINRVILVGGATRMTKIREIIWKIFHLEPTRGINPDEAVALGAAIQGAVMSGTVKDVLLLDVISSSLGLETYDGTMFRFIDSNTTTPTKKSEEFSTSQDNQSTIEINILEGEDRLAINNKSLGRFIMDDIPPLPAGVPKITVSFDIDANGILHVSATDKVSGRTVNVRIDVDSGLPAEQRENGMPSIRNIE